VSTGTANPVGPVPVRLALSVGATVSVRHDARARGVAPDDIHGICVPGARGGGLAQEVQRGGERDVYLLRVVAREHEDVGCGCRVS
jgi:hypothetical protein